MYFKSYILNEEGHKSFQFKWGTRTCRQDQKMLYKLLVDFMIISYAKLYKLENATLETSRKKKYFNGVLVTNNRFSLSRPYFDTSTIILGMVCYNYM